MTKHSLWREGPTLTRPDSCGGALLRMPGVSSRPARDRLGQPGSWPSGPDWQHESNGTATGSLPERMPTASTSGPARNRLHRLPGSHPSCGGALPIGAAVIDGEAVAFDAQGSADFHPLRSREGQANAVLVAYDVLELTAAIYDASRYRSAESA
jgi:hypothetical protein